MDFKELIFSASDVVKTTIIDNAAVLGNGASYNYNT